MNNFSVAQHVKSVGVATDERLSRFPDHPLFLFARREVDRIEDRLSSSKPIDKAFYDSLNIGLMCARELEMSDATFCTGVYDMLEEIRKRAESA